jgi:hypothetical protein
MFYIYYHAKSPELGAQLSGVSGGPGVWVQDFILSLILIMEFGLVMVVARRASNNTSFSG